MVNQPATFLGHRWGHILGNALSIFVALGNLESPSCHWIPRPQADSKVLSMMLSLWKPFALRSANLHHGQPVPERSLCGLIGE